MQNTCFNHPDIKTSISCKWCNRYLCKNCYSFIEKSYKTDSHYKCKNSDDCLRYQSEENEIKLKNIETGNERVKSSGVRIDPDKFPTMVVIGMDGPFDFNQILSIARRENRELIVMGNRSPAFKDHDLLLREAPKFRSDPSLVLIFEKYPNKNDFLCIDPLVIVRRDFLVEVGAKIQADTLGELAIFMTMEASAKNMKVSYV